MSTKTLTLLTVAALTALTGCQSWKNPTTQAPPDTNTTPLANTAPDPIPQTIPDNIPNPTPRGTDKTTAAEATTAQPRTTAQTPDDKPIVAQAPTPVPAAQPDLNKDGADIRRDALKTQDRPAGAGTGSGQGAAAVAPAATGPIAPATAPVDLGPVARAARAYVAADADDATVLRNWPVSVNTYPSGHVLAGPVYRIMAPPARSNSTSDVVATDLFQTVLTVPQMFATPFWMFATPPNTPVEYHGDQFPPSYTVNDPLPYYIDERVPGILQLKR